MPAAKPTLGYPSRTEAVLGLRREGLSAPQIADKIGIDVKAVAALEASAGRRGGVRRPADRGRVVLLPAETLRALGPAAAQRGITANCLARRIVKAVVADGLVDAVLDDVGGRDDEARP